MAGFSVRLNDLSLDQIKSSLATINGNLVKQIGKRPITEDERQVALSRITPAAHLEELADCDLVIETAG